MIILLRARHQTQLTTPAHMERVSSRVGKTLQQAFAYPFSAASSLATYPIVRCSTARNPRTPLKTGCGKKAKDIWLGNVTFRGVRTSDLHARSRSTSVRYVQLHFGRRARSRESSAAPDPPHGGCGLAGDVAQLFAAVRQ